MHITDDLLASGFARVIILDGAECSYPDVGSILLALWPYEAEENVAAEGAWVHPYYYASQKAYEAAAKLAKAYAARGLALRDDIRVKPILARLPGFSQGRNTLSYTADFGSRFHVQIFTLPPGLPATHHLEEEAHVLHCGNCHRCEAACPTNALEGGVFHRERCLRNWQMCGQPIPENLREKMGNRLIGCDECQRACPHNVPAKGEMLQAVDVGNLLRTPKAASLDLRPQIGVNLTIPNRVLGQACLIAGCSGSKEYLPLLESLCEHPSAVVADHAKWAVNQLKVK